MGDAPDGVNIDPDSKQLMDDLFAWGRAQRLGTHDAVPRPTLEHPERHLEDDTQPRAISDPVAYGRKALDGAVGNVRSATEGFRNHTLNAAAYSLGRLVGASLLDEATVIDTLRTAAEECGLEPREIDRTISSGLYSGMAQPLNWVKGVPPSATSSTDDDEALLAEATAKVRRQRQANRQVDQEEAVARFTVPPSGERVDRFVAQADEPMLWLIGDVLPLGANVTLTAPYKTGKTTMIGELLRSLCDGESFLGNHRVCDQRLVGNVGLWDYEMTTRQHRHWLKELGVVNGSRAWALHMRGHSLNLLSDVGADWAVTWLRDRNIGVWIIDPFARAYLGEENDNGAVTAWTDRIDVIKQRAGVHTFVMPVHTGRREGDIRARGATRIDDWPDVRWLLDNHDGSRYFRATGRDVEVVEVGLTYDRLTRRLLGDRPGRKTTDTTVDEAAETVFALLPAHGDGKGLSQAEICRQLGKRLDQDGKGFVGAAVDLLVKTGRAVNTGNKHRWAVSLPPSG